MVAGEAEDDEGVLVFRLCCYFLVQLFEAFELGGEAAFGGCVDDEDDFVAEGGEGVGLAFFYGVGKTGGLAGGWMGNGKGEGGRGGRYCRGV